MTNRKEVDYMSIKYVLSRKTEFDEMSVEEFCKNQSSSLEEFNEKIAMWKRLNFSDEECVILAKASYFYFNSVNPDKYENRKSVEHVKQYLDSLNEISYSSHTIEELSLSRAIENTPDCVCENTGWELPSNSPKYKKR